MAVTAESFRWLDILEKEFDKSFVDLDLLIGELDSDEPEMVYNARQKMATLSSCFAQLTHKAQTIFQNNAKNEVELVNVRAELVEMKTGSQCLEEELHRVLVQLHTTQLQQLPTSNEAELVNMRAELVEMKTHSQCLEEELHRVLVQLHTTQLQQLQTSNEVSLNISHKLQKGLLQRSPTHKASLTGVNLDVMVMSLENWKCRLEMENESLRHSMVSLQAEVCGARLAARYLDKELAGRIQQLQLLGRQDMSGDSRDRLWSQLEAEILLQRHKTVMRAVRQQHSHRSPASENVGRVRTVQLQRRPDQGLGISITGGREHGVPILISELEPGGENADLYVGDSVISVNGIDLSQASHQEAVKLLSNQTGNVTLKVQYLANCGEESEEDNDLTNLRYRFFEEMPEGMLYRMNGFAENNKQGGEMLVTPTAPRTPDSSARGGSECSYSSSPSGIQDNKCEPLLTSPTTTTHPSPPSLTPSPRHFGVTTLQKIFRSLTPSEFSEDKVISVGEKIDSEGTQEATEELSVQPIEPRTLPMKQVQDLKVQPAPELAPKVIDSPKIHVRRKVRTTSQVFHPDTEAVTLIDGLGDASFGTPV